MFGLFALIAAIGLSASSTAFCTVQESHPQDFNFASTIDPRPYISRSEMMGMLGMISSPAFTGEGIKVGITESAPSLYADAICMHTDELDALENSYNFQHEFEDALGHASIVANFVKMIAPDVEIYSNWKLKTYPYYRDFARSAEELIDTYDVDIINHSAGTSQNSGMYLDRSSAVSDLHAPKSGTLFVNAAGNVGVENLTHTTAAALGLDAVGVTNSEIGLDSVASDYENVLTGPIVSAPGNRLYGVPGSLSAQFEMDNNGSEGVIYDSVKQTRSGTSFSTPLITGIAALLMEEFPNLKNEPVSLKNILACSGSNYPTARIAAKNASQFIIDSNSTALVDDYYKEIEIPAGFVLTATATTEFDGSEVFHETIQTDESPVSPALLDYSSVAIDLKDSNGQDDTIATSTKNGNISKLVYKNDTSESKILALSAHVLGDKTSEQAETVHFCYRVMPEFNIYAKIDGKAYLDTTPIFEYQLPEQCNRIWAIFEDYQGNHIHHFENLDHKGSFALLSNQWKNILDLPNRTFYLRFEFDYDNVRFSSKAFKFSEPKEFEHSVMIRPEDFGFESQYFFSTKVEHHSFEGIGVTSERLRCGYIEDMYNNLSPKREGAGIAYLQLTFDKTIYSVSFGVTLWQNLQLASFREEDGMTVSLLQNGEWDEYVDILHEYPDFAMMDRDQILRFKATGGIDGIRFEAVSSASGSKNAGRVCIGDIVLSETEEDADYWLANYEPIVVRDTFWNGTLK